MSKDRKIMEAVDPDRCSAPEYYATVDPCEDPDQVMVGVGGYGEFTLVVLSRTGAMCLIDRIKKALAP